MRRTSGAAWKSSALCVLSVLAMGGCNTILGIDNDYTTASSGTGRGGTGGGGTGGGGAGGGGTGGGADAGPTLAIAGGDPNNLLIALDAQDLIGQAGIETWHNKGTLTGDFTAFGTPVLVSSPRAAVSFGGWNGPGTGDGYIGPASDERLGGNAPRSIEVWVVNASVDEEEPMVSWSKRAMANGTMMSFNYGTHPVWGAATHWFQDVGWGASGAPEANVWHHLVYTYDDTGTVTVYSDGSQKNAAQYQLDTLEGFSINLAIAREGDGFSRYGSLDLAIVRVHAGALTAAEVEANYEAEKSRFGL